MLYKLMNMNIFLKMYSSSTNYREPSFACLDTFSVKSPNFKGNCPTNKNV